MKNLIKEYSRIISEDFDKEYTELKNYNYITLLESPRKNMNKTFYINEEGVIDVKANFSKYFGMKEVAIQNIGDIAALLAENANNQKVCFTRASPTEFAKFCYYNNTRVRKLTKDKLDENNVIIEQSTLKDTPKNWVMIDVDNFKVNYSLKSHENRKYALKEFIQTLPNCFQDVSYAVQYSNGMLVKEENNLKAHIFFMTDSPMCSEHMRPWVAENCEYADPCTFNKAQLFFIAKPFFGKNLIDPFENTPRIFLKNEANSFIKLPYNKIKEQYIYNNIVTNLNKIETGENII
jgi:hypothetical protein